MTGIKRKTWYKRFERLEKKLKQETNSRSEKLNQNNSNLTIQNNGDKNERETGNSSKPLKLQDYLAFIIILIIALALIAPWAYKEYKKWKMQK